MDGYHLSAFSNFVQKFAREGMKKDILFISLTHFTIINVSLLLKHALIYNLQ